MTASTITKNILSESLKELLYEKPFNKISVLDITKKSGLNRQTFYYHFEDKFELIKWIYNNDLLHISNEITLDNWNIKLLDALKVLKKQKHFYVCIVKCDENYFKSYFFNVIKKLFLKGIKKIDVEKTLDNKNIDFFATYFSHGMCGIIIDWIRNGMKEDEEEITKRLKSLVDNIKAYVIEGLKINIG